MEEQPLFGIVEAEDTVVMEALRDLSDFEYERLESAAAEALTALEADGIHHIVIDLSKSSYYASAALGLFLKLWKRVRTKNGKMAFCGVSNPEMEILRLSQLDQLWIFCDSRDEAIKTVRAN